MALTPRQKRFVEAYDGNAADAARKAGYTGSNKVLAITGYHLKRHPKIREALDAREEGVLKRLALNVAELQEEWSNIVLDKTEDVTARLRASDLLAKSQGAFIQRHELSVGKSLEDLLRETLTEEPSK